MAWESAKTTVSVTWTSGSASASLKLTVNYAINNDTTQWQFKCTGAEWDYDGTTGSGHYLSVAKSKRLAALDAGISAKFIYKKGSTITNLVSTTVTDSSKSLIYSPAVQTVTKTHSSQTDITYYVQFNGEDGNHYTPTIGAKPSYTVTYNGNGITLSTTSATKWYGQSLTLLAAQTRTNYVFKRWNTNTSDSGTGYTGGASYTSNAALTLYAIWNPKITYNVNGGSSVTSPVTKTFNVDYTLASAPTKTNYAFNRWNTKNDNTGTGYVGGAKYTGNSALTLYAIWNPKITYNVNSGSSVTSPVTKTYGVDYTLASGVTKTGYYFNNWNTNNSNTGTSYAAGAKYTSNTAATLYAIWDPQIVYNVNGGSSVTTPQRKTYGTNYTIASAPTKTGYAFNKWYTNNNFSGGTGYNAGAKYTGNTALTLYAIWNPIITYVLDEDVVTPSGFSATQTKTYGTNLTLQSGTPTKTNYYFLNWKGSDNNNYNPGATYTSNNTLTLTANWDKIYSVPKIKLVSLSRCDSQGVLDAIGGYLKVTVDWLVYIKSDDSTYGSAYGANAVLSASVTNANKNTTTYTSDTMVPTYQEKNGTEWNRTSFILVNSTTGYQLTQNESPIVTVTIRETKNNTTATINPQAPTGYFPIDVLRDGSGLALGAAATQADVLKIGYSNIIISEETDLNDAITALGWESEVIVT